MSQFLHIEDIALVIEQLKSFLDIDDEEACQIAGVSRYMKKIHSPQAASETVVVTGDEHDAFRESQHLTRLMAAADKDAVREKLGCTSSTSARTYRQLLLMGPAGVRQARKRLMAG